MVLHLTFHSCATKVGSINNMLWTSRIKFKPTFKGGTLISYAVVQCLFLLHSFPKYSQNQGSEESRFRLLENETLKIFRIWEKRKNIHKFDGTKVCRAEEVKKYFANPKIEIEVFSYIIWSLDFKNVSFVLFLLHMKIVDGII